MLKNIALAAFGLSTAATAGVGAAAAVVIGGGGILVYRHFRKPAVAKPTKP